MPGSQVVLVVKNPAANAGDIKEATSNPGSGRFPWRRAWQPSPVFLPGESHGQRSLAGYSPWGHSETQLKWLSTHAQWGMLSREHSATSCLALPPSTPNTHTHTHTYTHTVSGKRPELHRQIFSRAPGKVEDIAGLECLVSKGEVQRRRWGKGRECDQQRALGWRASVSSLNDRDLTTVAVIWTGIFIC